MKPLSLQEAAKRYAARVEYRKRLSRIIRRCRCSREEETEYDGYQRMTYPGSPSCYDMEVSYSENYLPNPVFEEELSSTEKAWKEWYDKHRDARQGVIWCARCVRRGKLIEARRKAAISEGNSLRGLLKAAKREEHA